MFHFDIPLIYSHSDEITLDCVGLERFQRSSGEGRNRMFACMREIEISLRYHFPSSTDITIVIKFRHWHWLGYTISSQIMLTCSLLWSGLCVLIKLQIC